MKILDPVAECPVDKKSKYAAVYAAVLAAAPEWVPVGTSSKEEARNLWQAARKKFDVRQRDTVVYIRVKA